MEKVYFDTLNGGPLLPEAAAAMQAALGLEGNPSSPGAEGRAAALAVERARAEVAGLLNGRPEEICFTSSGTEANNWALAGLAKPLESRGRHLILSAVEHQSVLQQARRMEKEGWKATVLPVDRAGQVSPEDLEKALTPETVLVSIQWANAEVGTLQPVAECLRRAKARGILFHTDAVAAAGQVPVDLRAVPVDALSLAARPWGGPGGVGALFVRKGVRLAPLLVGGAQEAGRRAGTENLPGIVGMGKAARMASRHLAEGSERLASLRDRLRRGIAERIPEAVFHGHPVERLPGHLSVSFPGWEAETLVLALDREGVAAGIGSACSRHVMKASHVLKAMGVGEREALGAVTFTLGFRAAEAEVDRALDALQRVVTRGVRAAPFTALSSGERE